MDDLILKICCSACLVILFKRLFCSYIDYLYFCSNFVKSTMTDISIRDALLARDEQLTRQFFFENCRPLFMSIIKYVFSYEVDYDEFVNEFYLHLMENDAYRLKQFEGKSTIYQWLKVVAIRYFVAKRDGMIDMESKEPLLERKDCSETVDNESKVTARIDIDNLLGLMDNRRYEYVLRRLLLDDAEPKVVADELLVSVDNLYNIKKRAFASLTQIALKEFGEYGK